MKTNTRPLTTTTKTERNDNKNFGVSEADNKHDRMRRRRDERRDGMRRKGNPKEPGYWSLLMDRPMTSSSVENEGPGSRNNNPLHLVHTTLAIESSATTVSALVEPPVFVLCLLGTDSIAPFPVVVFSS